MERAACPWAFFVSMAFCMWLTGFAETGCQLVGPDLSLRRNEYKLLWDSASRETKNLSCRWVWMYNICLGLLLEVRDGESIIVIHTNLREEFPN